jgi:uncharacterized membrane protein (UPF0136 family)
MKNGFRTGLLLGLIVGVVIGYFTSHLWVWLFAAVAIGIVIASYRMKRPKFLPPRTVGQ